MTEDPRIEPPRDDAPDHEESELFAGPAGGREDVRLDEIDEDEEDEELEDEEGLDDAEDEDDEDDEDEE